MDEIRLAIVGVGNCANSLLQGLNYYRLHQGKLLHPKIGPYGPANIVPVAAFDIAETKVGQELAEAAWAHPNDTLDFCPIPDTGVTVARGTTLDGFGRYLKERVPESREFPDDAVRILRDAGATVLVNYLPVGAQAAAEFYASAALKAGCAFVNCMPVFLASSPSWSHRFADAGLPIIGDDIKSQVGATIVHRRLAQLLRDRGVKLKRTYQLNVGGNSDFFNMLERDRLESKKISKTGAVLASVGYPMDDGTVHVGPSDHVPWLTDRKVAYIRLEAEGFGGAPMNIEVRMEVWDSPNSAGIVIDAIRCAQLAFDAGLHGAQEVPSAVFMKTPPRQMDDDLAIASLEKWIEGIEGGEEKGE